LDKLLTEISVRQLMKANKLSDNDQLTLPRGTILTPSARSFLGEHQIKINQTNTSGVKIQEGEKAKPNTWLETIQVTHKPVDFNQISDYGTPLIHLQAALREQLLLYLTLLNEQKAKVNQDVVNDSVAFVNQLISASFDQVWQDDEYSLDTLKLSDLKLQEASLLTVQKLQGTLDQVAFSLVTWLTVQPNLRNSTFYEAVVSWQILIQEWLNSLLEK